jgi:hypothetical protein
MAREQHIHVSTSMTAEGNGRLGLLDSGDLRDMRHSGILEAVIGHADLETFLNLARLAAKEATANGKTWWVVRSITRLYICPEAPAETRDIDAIYVLEVRPR